MSNLSFPSTYSRMLAKELSLGDAGITELLAGTALARKDLFSISRQIALGEQITIIRNGLRLSGNPALGLQIGLHMPLSAHGAIGVALAAAPNPLEAFEILSRYGILRVPVLSVRMQREADALVLEIASDMPTDDVSRFLIEVLVASMAVLTETSAGLPARQAHIEFGYPEPPYADCYRDYLQADLRFGQTTTRLRFLLADLEHPNPFADPEVFAQAIDMCERLRVRLTAQESWHARVAGVLQQHPGHIWQVAEVAVALSTSVRSLTRHLAQEGSSYQRVMDEELCRQALLHLSLPGQTVAAVANTLGYQDVSSFRRAFRRWRGQSPEAWRQAGAK